MVTYSRGSSPLTHSMLPSSSFLKGFGNEVPSKAAFDLEADTESGKVDRCVSEEPRATRRAAQGPGADPSPQTLLAEGVTARGRNGIFQRVLTDRTVIGVREAAATVNAKDLVYGPSSRNQPEDVRTVFAQFCLIFEKLAFGLRDPVTDHLSRFDLFVG